MNKFTSKMGSPLPSDLEGECKKAVKILNNLVETGNGMVDKMIPANILENAQGLAIYTALKAGFLFSGRLGSGLAIARLPNGEWSAPSAIGLGGVGAGGQIGAELAEVVLILNTKEAVKTFSHGGNVSLGGNISVAAGPLGRNAEASGTASFKHVAPVYSYSRTRGLFAGVSLEGSVILTRNDANAKFYGKTVTAKELLNGTIPAPPEADVLRRTLKIKCGPGNGSPGNSRLSEEEESRYNSTSNNMSRTPRPLPPSQNNQPQTGGYGTPSFSAGPPSYSANSQLYNEKSNYQQAVPQQSYPIQSKPSSRPAPPPPPSRPHETRAKALYDFAGEQAGDLAFRTGDIIIVTEKSGDQNDWWTGKLGNGEPGIFPANYVQLLSGGL